MCEEPIMGYFVAMDLILWIIAAVLVIGGIVALVRGQVLCSSWSA